MMRHSAGVVVARQGEEGWLLLLLRCYRNWDFPKGGIEPGESPMQAALRETREESGITQLAFKWGEDFRETEPYGRPPKIARYYLAETREARILLSISPSLGRPEHHEGRWVSPAQAKRMLPARLQGVLEWATHLLAS